jgi:HAD superfamily hydrolase (TIGR01490 family)
MTMRIGAFFDMDRTLLRCNTGTLWIRFLRRRGEISTWKTLRAMSWIARYKLSLLDMEAVVRVATRDVTGDIEHEMIDKARIFFDSEVVHTVAPKAREALEFHRKEGHELAILSTSTPYVAEPLARYLGIDHVLCTRLTITDGKFTGTHIAPACAGPGKVVWAERFAKERGVDLDASWFYTDSYSDLPMLKRVGVKMVINPDFRLRRHARRAGWRMEEW